MHDIGRIVMFSRRRGTLNIPPSNPPGTGPLKNNLRCSSWALNPLHALSSFSLCDSTSASPRASTPTLELFEGRTRRAIGCTKTKGHVRRPKQYEGRKGRQTTWTIKLGKLSEVVHECVSHDASEDWTNIWDTVGATCQLSRGATMVNLLTC